MSRLLQFINYLPQKYIIPDTFVKVINTHNITNNEPTKSEIRQIVATAIAKVANPTFRYSSPRIICNY